MSEDLSVAGPYSPVSLKKFLYHHPTSRPLTVLIDGTGLGIVKDEEGMLYITPEDCSQQALHYCKTIFDGKRVPAYLYRYLHYMFINNAYHPKYNSDQDVANAFINKELTEESEEYIQIRNMITYAEHNTELLQVIGLIQLIGGSLNMARKSNSGLRLYLDRPETALHPKRQSSFMSMFEMLRKDYGWKEDA